MRPTYTTKIASATKIICLSLLLFIGQGLSAQTRIQSAKGNTSSNAQSSFTVTLPVAPKNGNTLIAVISGRTTTVDNVISISQTGTTWTRAVSDGSSNTPNIEIWYTTTLSGGGTTITINQGSTRAAAVIMEYSGLLYSAPLDKYNSNNNNSSWWGSTDATTGTTTQTTAPNELWIGSIALSSSGHSLSGISDSFLEIDNAASTNSTTSNNAKVYALERTVNATGTASTGGTVSSWSRWSGAIATFKASSISSFSPASACSGTITINGSGFTGASAVKFNGVNAASYNVVSDTQITAVLSAPATTGLISVTMQGGLTAYSKDIFLVKKPPIPTAVITNTTCPSSTDGTVFPNNIPHAVNFNPNQSQYIDLGTSLLSNLGAFTMEGWIKTTSYNRNSFFGQDNTVEIGFASDGNIELWSEGLNVNIYAPYPSDGVWHHVAGVGNGNNMTIYVDGIQVATRSHNSLGTSGYGASTATAKIGGYVWNSSTPNYFNGQMLKVGFWNRALTISEIANLASSPHGYTSGNGLIAGYNFYEGTGSSLTKTPSGTNGTLLGSPTSTWSDIFNYSWTKTGDAGYNANTKNISGLSTGTYMLGLTHLLEGGGGTCASTASFVVGSTGTESTAPSAMTGTSPVCSGAQVELSLTGGSLGSTAAWKWYAAACGTNPITTGLSNGGRTLTVTPTSTTSYYARAEGTCNSTDCVSFTVIVNATGTWLGYNTDWNAMTNWCGSVPTSTTDVIIPANPIGGNQPTVGSAGAVCKTLTIDAGATVTMGGAYNFNIYGNLTNNGTFAAATSTVLFNENAAVLGSTSTAFHNLTVLTGKTLTASAATMNITGNWTNNGTFANNAGTVAFTGTTAQEIKGTNTFNNLTINNATAGVIAKNDITVNGVLNLASANPSAILGTLDMSPVYTGDVLTSYKTLYMGTNATTIGVGDVTGVVTRISIPLSTELSFANALNKIEFFNDVQGNLPTQIDFVTRIGTRHSAKNNSVNRHYQIVRTGGSGTTKFNLKLHYLDSELDTITESRLVFWDHHVTYNGTSPHEHGKTQHNLTDNWLALNGHAIGYLAPEYYSGEKTYSTFPERANKEKIWLISGKELAGEFVWLGAKKSTWNEPSNWNGGIVPTNTSNVLIPELEGVDPFYPILPADTTFHVKSLTIMAGASMTVGANNTIEVYGDLAANNGTASWSNEGTFNASTSMVKFLGTNAAITGNTQFYNVEIPVGKTLSMVDGTTVAIAGTFTNAGTLDTDFDGPTTFVYNGTSAQSIATADYYNLELTGTATKTLPTTSIGIKGNLNLSSTIISTNNTVVFNGDIAQTLSGSSTSALNNVTMSNAAGLTLSKSQTMNGALTLSSGLVNTGSNVLTVDCNGSITGQSASSYINGKLAREYCSASSKVYPIGMGGNYRPLTLEYSTLTGGSSTVLAEQFESEIQGTIPNDITYQTTRYWNLTETAGTGNGNYKISLDASPFTAAATPKILRGNGTANTAFNATASVSPYFTTDNLSDNVFGNFAVASECLAPDITTQPQGTEACELSGTATFTVVPQEGTYTLTYSWEVNTGNNNWTTVSNGGVYSNATTATLSISNPPYSMNGYNYRANVARDCGGTATTTAATLTVNPLPQGSLTGMQNICKGDEGFLTWTATAGTGPFSLVYNAGAGNVTVPNIISGAAFSVGTITTNTSFTLVSVTGTACSRTTDFTVGSADVTVNPYITWTGATSTDWNTASNWCGGIPTATDNVQIPDVANEPLISNTPTATTNSLIIDNNSSVTIAGEFTLDIKGNLTNNGILTGAEGTLAIDGYIENNGTINTKNSIPQRDTYGGTVVLNGTAAQTLQAGTYNNIVIDNAAGVTMPIGANVTTQGTFEVKSGAKMEIGTGRTVIANTLLNSAGAAGIRIKAAAGEPNGTLIFNNAVDNPAQATVEMHSPASWNLSAGANQKYYWQYFGIPVKRVSQLGTNFYGAFVRRYNEPGFGTSSSTPLQNRLWVQLQNNDFVSNKKGYELTQATALKYAFAGELYNSDMDTTLSYSSSGQYPGQHVLSNPYTSAIDITKIVFDENMDQTVYIYNTGSYANWGANTDPNKLGSSPGQYIAAPKNTAGSGDIPAEIPSMQGFLVRTNVAGEGSIFISYNAVKKSNTGPQRAPKAPMTWLRLNLQGAIADGDVMWIFSSPQTTEGNDNGWDGRKFASASGTPMLYSLNETGAYQIDARPDIHETNIVFRGGALDNEYSLTFNNENMGRDYGNIYLFDKETGVVLNITESGTKYDFTSSGTGSSYRFQILTSLPEVTNTEKADEPRIKVFSSSHFLYIDNQSDNDYEVEIYDQIGRLLGQYQSKASQIKSIDTSFSPGTYIVRTKGSDKQGTVVIIK